MFLLYLSASIIAALITSAAFAYLWRRKLERDMKTKGTFKKLRDEINNMLTDINGATERNIVLIENKIRTMSSLIDRANKLENVLRKEKQEISSNVYTKLGRSRPLNLVLENKNNELDEHEDNTEQSGNPKLKTLRAPNYGSAGFQSLSTQEKVLILFRKGESVEQIASILGISRGETELTISIHDKRD
ncbi:hypothetical protein S1OALGB6SA_433 [Olavius algarvensis spirochete endosymbiont]|nr:hypothetical protein S1OALGB6SA_433 [Olavius algarvensis spirochete endosymbiont]